MPILHFVQFCRKSGLSKRFGLSIVLVLRRRSRSTHQQTEDDETTRTISANRASSFRKRPVGRLPILRRNLSYV